MSGVQRDTDAAEGAVRFKFAADATSVFLCNQRRDRIVNKRV